MIADLAPYLFITGLFSKGRKGQPACIHKDNQWLTPLQGLLKMIQGLHLFAEGFIYEGQPKG